MTLEPLIAAVLGRAAEKADSLSAKLAILLIDPATLAAELGHLVPGADEAANALAWEANNPTAHPENVKSVFRDALRKIAALKGDTP